jgi:hypothetical protein
MSTVLIAGGTGLVGQYLSSLLKEKGYAVFHLSRHKNPNGEFPAYAWDVTKRQIDREAVEKADYIIHLAGAGVADARWTAARKKLIIDSRVESTLLLKEAIAQKTRPLKAYIAASAIGFYGNRGEQFLKETDEAGKQGFLPESVVAWEQAIQQVAKTGVRTVGLRIGIVLSTKGGALQKILLPFKAFNGAYFGNGQQWYSWIHIEDVCRMFIEALESEKIQGFYNAVAPQPVRNKDLIIKTKEALGIPALVVSAPSGVLRLVMGEMADMILDSAKVSSEKIEKTGFRFRFPELRTAIGDLLKRKI